MNTHDEVAETLTQWLLESDTAISLLCPVAT